MKSNGVFTVVFWQSMVSPHQVPYLMHLPTLQPDFDYVLIVDVYTKSERAKMGWAEQVLQNFKVIENPNYVIIHKYAVRPNTVHIFGGIKGTRTGWKAIRLVALKTKSKIIVMSEAPDLRGFRRITRTFLAWGIEKVFKWRISAVLYIGTDAKLWYERNGFSKEILFPFSYVVHDSSSNVYEVFENKKPKFVFVGSLIELKGVDRLLDSFSGFSGFTLDIYGEGKELVKLKRKVEKRNLVEQVFFRENVPNSQIRQILSRYDFLVLPSYYDGWGAVVNEALMDGVMVIVSDACGSSFLIEKNSMLGYVFQSDNPESLRKTLVAACRDFESFSPDRRREIKNWAKKNISGEVIAKYFISVLDIVLNGKVKPKGITFLNEQKK